MAQTVLDNATADRLAIEAAVYAVRRQIERETATFSNGRMLQFLKLLAGDVESHQLAVVARIERLRALEGA